MRAGIFLNGLFPRSKKIREALRSFQKKKIDLKEMKEIYEEEAKKYVEIQKDIGCYFISDGLLMWQDLLRPLCNYDGIKEGTLIRWFETNFFYRMPIVNDRIQLKEPVLKDFYCINALKGVEGSVIAFPDPLTFALLSENLYYSSIKDLVEDLAKVMVEDIAIASKEVGTKNLLVLSPVLYYNVDLSLLKDFFERLSSIGSRIILHLSFVKRLNSKELHGLDFDLLSVDLCFGDREALIKELDFRSLGLGLIDTLTSLIEDPNYLFKEVSRIKAGIRALKEIFVTNSSDLDLLPYEVALEKIKNLKRLHDYEF